MKKRYSETQIVAKLRQADILIGKGSTIPGKQGQLPIKLVKSQILL